MSHDAPTTQRTLATDTNLVIREARRRQRRRRLVAGLVLAVMLAGAAGRSPEAGLATSGRPPRLRLLSAPPPGPGPLSAGGGAAVSVPP